MPSRNTELGTSREASVPADVTLHATPREVWEEASACAWNDDTLDFFLSEWEKSNSWWDTFSIVYGAKLPSNFLEANFTSPEKPVIFALRALYERHLGARISEEDILTLEAQTQLWQAIPISAMPDSMWELLPLSSDVVDGILNLMWTKDLLLYKGATLRPYFESKKRRLGFNRLQSGSFYSLLGHPNLADEAIFKWLVAAGNFSAPHRNTRKFWHILQAVVENSSVSRRTLRTALRITLRAVPGQSEEEYDHFYHVSRRVMQRGVAHPQMDVKMLTSFLDAGLIPVLDYEGYVEELGQVYDFDEEEGGAFQHPSLGDSYVLEGEKIAQALAAMSKDGSGYVLLDNLTKGFPVPAAIWDAFLSKLERDRLEFSSTTKHLLNTALIEIPPPPKEVVFKTLEIISLAEPINGMLHYYGYAVKQLREQAVSDGLPAADLPVEWLTELYT